MSAGGSALPCATPSSAPMPSFCICSRSRTSHSNWYSEAIVCAASATFEGVSRLAGSFTRPRVKFCASASMRPRATAPSSSVPEPAATTANASTDFLSSSVVYRSGSNSPRIAPSTAAAAYSPPACSASSARAIFFTDFDFKCRTAAPATLRNSTGSNFSTFPTPATPTPRGHGGGTHFPPPPPPAQRPARGRYPRRPVQQRQLEGLSRHLAGVGQIAGAEARFLPAFENQHNQRAGLNPLEGLAFNRNPHHYRL